MRKPSSRKDFEVYEFKDEEEIELKSRRILNKFKSPRKRNLDEFRECDTSPLTKYQFLKSFSSGVKSQGKRMSTISCIDLETSDRNHNCNNHGSPSLHTSNEGNCVIEEKTLGPEEILVCSPISNREDAHSNHDGVECVNLFPGCTSVSSVQTSCWNEDALAKGASSPGVPLSGDRQTKCNLSELLSSNNSVDEISEDDEREAYSFDIKEDQEGSAMDHFSGGCEMENINMAVVLHPDYLIYKDLYCTESSLSFSSNCIQLEGQNAYGRKQFISSEWSIVDIIDIESRWYARVETALLKLWIRPKPDVETEILNGVSGVVELKFAVYDPHWFARQEKILSVDCRYKNIWRDLIDVEDAFVRKNQSFSLKPYYPIFDEHFEEVIYPKGDPDAVSINKRDVELLQPETFINDTIIDFYIKYLKNRIKPEDRNRFHFFNSFFFRKLADLDKNPSSASEGRAAFLRVRKWTRKVNLFEKDYVFIPVNFNLHWSLIVICHPGEVATYKDERSDKSHKVPCILHMDSIKGSHKGLKILVQSYLWEEWKERQPEPPEDISPNFFNLRLVPLELPQQENSFDCGLFLLHYVERFLEEAPDCFSPFKLTKSSKFLNFEPAEASLKRSFIQNLIYEVLKGNSPESLSAIHEKESQSHAKENGVEFLLGQQIAANSCSAFFCNGLSSLSNDDERIEIKLLGTPDEAQYVGDSGLVLKDFLEPGTIAGSFFNGHFQSFDQTTSCNKFKAVMSPIKEDEETGEQFAARCTQMGGYAVNDVCTTSYIGKGYEMYDTCSNPGTCMGQNEDDDYGLSSGTSSCDSQGNFEPRVDGTPQIRRSWCPTRQEEADKLRPTSSENMQCSTESQDSDCSEGLHNCVVEDSEDMSRVADEDGKMGSHSSCQENFPTFSDHRQALSVKNENDTGNNQDLGDEMDASELVEARATKRARLTLSAEDCSS
ncbi:Sentrin-specific protease [Thalictrum thalictroides]|uniref:Sentrin-specific protease n=1 Tax=Thalictrum thalictroides TaxID=46969 RepID=A0A7J6V4W5_THATH|nr:Sentrin-specific protease [Thalictrum thalictroides]